MGFIAFLTLGLLAGAIAKARRPGRDSAGVIATMVIGAILGGYLASRVLDIDAMQQFFHPTTWATAVAGALLVLAISRLLARR